MPVRAAGRIIGAVAASGATVSPFFPEELDRRYSIVDGRRKDWSQWATTITPATSVHSHHNAGNSTAMFLIVQDGGIYYHTRALGFEFADA